MIGICCPLAVFAIVRDLITFNEPLLCSFHELVPVQIGAVDSGRVVFAVDSLVAVLEEKCVEAFNFRGGQATLEVFLVFHIPFQHPLPESLQCFCAFDEGLLALPAFNAAG